MKLNFVLRNPFFLAVLLGIIFLIIYQLDILPEGFAEILLYILGILSLVIINFGRSDTFKKLMINHTKFIITISLISFFVIFFVEEDFEEAGMAFLGEIFWFSIIAILINSVKNMKKSHWIVIGALSFLTVVLFLYACVQTISHDMDKKINIRFYETATNRITILEERLKASEAKIDSLNNIIYSLKVKK